MTEDLARAWMRANVALALEHSEINTTRLAEACADAFDQADEGGPLDDETHWIWDVAVEVRWEIEAHLRNHA